MTQNLYYSLKFYATCSERARLRVLSASLTQTIALWQCLEDITSYPARLHCNWRCEPVAWGRYKRQRYRDEIEALQDAEVIN